MHAPSSSYSFAAPLALISFYHTQEVTQRHSTSILNSVKSPVLTALMNCILYVYNTVNLPSDFLLQKITWVITPLPSTAHSLLILEVTTSKPIFVHIQP